MQSQFDFGDVPGMIPAVAEAKALHSAHAARANVPPVAAVVAAADATSFALPFDDAAAAPVETAAFSEGASSVSSPVSPAVPSSMTSLATASAPADEFERIFSDRLWCDDGWTARVIKNEDDDGWAVAMFKDGEAEPALVGPWTMGRDKKNPKPLDAAAFGVLVKTASEVLRRHEQQRHALLHKSVFVTSGDADLNITLDIKPNEDDPHAILSAYAADGACLARMRVAPDFKFDRRSALKWAGNGFARPA